MIVDTDIIIDFLRRQSEVLLQVASQYHCYITAIMIGLPDTMIAGICLSQDLPLLTRNTRHYTRVAGLQIFTPDNLPLT